MDCTSNYCKRTIQVTTITKADEDDAEYHLDKDQPVKNKEKPSVNEKKALSLEKQNFPKVKKK